MLAQPNLKESGLICQIANLTLKEGCDMIKCMDYVPAVECLCLSMG